MKPLHLFEGLGVELEYMIVDRVTLAARPECDRILNHLAGHQVDEWASGRVGWSNELVAHVIEAKTNGPEADLPSFERELVEQLHLMGPLLESLGIRLLPTAMHPLFNPDTETVLWPHGNMAIYRAYDRIFSCRGHGWSNLQSTHINLPFANDQEFHRLHSAVRLILPLIPVMAASSPIVAGRSTGKLDNRLHFYKGNQLAVPEIVGPMIPEQVASEQEYRERILQPMFRAMDRWPEGKLLQEEWLNSRAAIARFDRMAIEIRIMDVQECPRADMALVAFVQAILKGLVFEKWSRFKNQQEMGTSVLVDLWRQSITGDYVIEDQVFLSCFGIEAGPVSASALLRLLVHKCSDLGDPIFDHYQGILMQMLNRGCLAQSMLAAIGVGKDPLDPGPLAAVYRELATCLTENRLFKVC